MKFLGMDQFEKKDTLIYYRHEYSGIARFALIGDKEATVRFSSSIEIKPTGEREVNVELLDRIDYPVLPIIKSLKNEILAIEKAPIDRTAE
ncbi:MAG: hypothetical protein PQJ50_04270 [Spirochaetales bacterium]|nr:hypothetical protein [Spirochaetales bacterium]